MVGVLMVAVLHLKMGMKPVLVGHKVISLLYTTTTTIAAAISSSSYFNPLSLLWTRTMMTTVHAKYHGSYEPP